MSKDKKLTDKDLKKVSGGAEDLDRLRPGGFTPSSGETGGSGGGSSSGGGPGTVVFEENPPR